MVLKRNLSSALVALLFFTSTGCIAIQANQRRPGSIADGSFNIARPPEATYGYSALTCPAGGLFQLVSDELQELAKHSAKLHVKGDGRLCAMADTLSGWTPAEPPPESVRRHVAWHFGLPGPTPRVVIAHFESDPKGEESLAADRGSAEKIVGVIVRFAEQSTSPRFGLQSEIVRKADRAHPKELSRVVVVLQDGALDLDPVPRALPLNGQTKIAGRLPPGVSSATLVSCDPGGKLETQELQVLQGGAFSANLRCGERAGKLLVELRAQKVGSEPEALARFPIGCGAEWPAAVKLPARAPAALDLSAEERRLFELINSERAAAGLPAVTWRDALGKVARAAAESLRPDAAARAPFDLNAKLREADSASPVVLQNPVAARGAEEAHATLAVSPVNRSNLLNATVTHGGVGASFVDDPAIGPVLYAVELLVREQGPVDTEDLRARLRAAIAQARSTAGAAPLASDALIEQVALQYAAEAAAGGGALPKGRDSDILFPLFKSYHAVNIISGAKPDPLDFAREQGIVGPGALLGVGVAQGSSPALGKNAVFVVVVLAKRNKP
jgi:uncharacterized protein YkwD